MTKRNEEKEIEISKAFFNVCDLTFKLDSIKKTYPPNPDIQCEVIGTGLLAFELVEIMDQKYANLFEKTRDTKEGLDRYHSNLLSEKKDCFDQLYSNATIVLDFRNDCTLRQREKLFPIIIDHLLTLPDQFEGKTFENSREYNNLREISISRSRYKHFCFSMMQGGFFTNPTVPAINSKFKKKYKSKYPIHLLVHYNDTPMIPEDDWLPLVEEFLNEHGQECQFEKIWIFDYSNKEIKFEYP